jgi:hypothetical protein
MIVLTDAVSTRRLGARMPDKAPKAKAKARANENGVLGALPATRPERLGAPRNGAAKPRRGPAPQRSAKPRAVRAAAPELTARHAADPPPEPLGAPSGRELVATTIRATGELAQIGLVVGGQVLKRTISRFPRP